MKMVEFFLIIGGKMVQAGAGIFDKLEPHKNGPAPRHWGWAILLRNRRVAVPLCFSPIPDLTIFACNTAKAF
jgi:hypothetical protein